VNESHVSSVKLSNEGNDKEENHQTAAKVQGSHSEFVIALTGAVHGLQLVIAIMGQKLGDMTRNLGILLLEADAHLERQYLPCLLRLKQWGSWR